MVSCAVSVIRDVIILNEFICTGHPHTAMGTRVHTRVRMRKGPTANEWRKWTGRKGVKESISEKQCGREGTIWVRCIIGITTNEFYII